MNTTLLLQQLLNGLAIGSVYAIFALGYTLIFSVLRIVNFAQGAVFTLGAYFAYALTGAQFGFNGLLAQAALPIKLPFFVALLGGAVLHSPGAVELAPEAVLIPPSQGPRRSPNMLGPVNHDRSFSSE